MRRTRGLRGTPVVAAVIGLTLAACGSGRTDATDAGPAPSRVTATSAAAPGSDPSAPGAGEPGEPGAPGAGGAGGTATTEVGLYFTRGERVTRVVRAVPKVSRIGAEAVKALLAGPNAQERRAGLATAIPAGTEFRDLVIQDGVARVDLSGAFESGGGGLGLTLRLAQVACTLDAFPSVTGVRFALDGRLRDVLSGDGVVVDRPVTCASYGEYVEGSPPPTAAFAGIWPFSSAEEMEAYARGGDSTFRDAGTTAKEFARRYLGMASPVTFAFRTSAAGYADVPVGFGTGEGGALRDAQPTTTVQLRQLVGEGPDAPWTVVGAVTDLIVVDQPGEGAPTVASPVSVRGRASAFEGTVDVEVREDGMVAGQALGRGFVTGRGDGVLGPFSGQIGFRAPTKPAGAVVFFEKSMADGSALRATVVRVRF